MAERAVQLTNEQRLRLRALFFELNFNKGEGKPCDSRFLQALLRRQPKDVRLIEFPSREIMDRVDEILGPDEGGNS